jgi:hypothetical protein
MGVTRRQFLQQVGGALAAWGVSEMAVWPWRDRYRQALAAPTPRKLALLIGINQYPFSSSLEGCVTDVELQRELLIHRFGFQAADVVTLTDAQATHAAVTSAFLDHLIPTAKPGDIVVVHFSGFGSTVAAGPAKTAWSSLVLADGAPTGETPVVNDLLLETLGLLLRSLKTDRVTTILDTSYFYPGQPLQGNLRVRTYPNPSTAQITEAELALQDTLLSQLKMNRDRFPTGSDFSAFPGVVLTASNVNQVATEVRWNHFNAGLFTNTLTQSLWQATSPMTIGMTLKQVAQQVEAIVSQQRPTVQGQATTAKNQESKRTPYFIPGSIPGAVGAIVALEDNGSLARLWLGGLPATLLEHYGVNSLLTVVSPSREPSTLTLQITAREGFTARAKVCCVDEGDAENSLQVGQLVQEAVRVLPRNIGLTVALDGSLERIERVDAISAFTAVPRVSFAIAGEQPADLLFSKVAALPTQLAALPSLPMTRLAATPSTISYGLFSPGRDVILSTTGEGGEAVKVAVKRLVPKLQTLLATKLLHLTVNDQTSQLALMAQLEQITPQAQVLASQSTDPVRAAAAMAKGASQRLGDLVQIPLGSRIRFRLENKGQQPLYSLAIALDTASNLQWLHVPTPDPDPNLQIDASTVSATILPNMAATLPTAIAGSEWQIQGTSGFAETYLILSRAPFTQTLAILTTQQRSGSSAIAGNVITSPLEIVQAILQDLHQASHSPAIGPTPDTYTLDVSTWATLRFSYQVI